jgi:hypothetical protein
VSVQDGRILKYEAATTHFVDFAFDSPTRLDLEHLQYECLVIDIETDFNKGQFKASAGSRGQRR